LNRVAIKLNTGLILS